MKIGFEARSIDHRGLSVEALLDFAVEHHLDGVRFPDATSIDPGLDRARLIEARAMAESRGLILGVGLPSINPTRRSKAEGGPVEPAEHSRNVIRHLEAAASLGCRHVRTYLGDRHDRFRTDFRWDAQLEAAINVLERMELALRSTGLVVALQTHADATAEELLGFLNVFDPDVLGLAIDPGNLAMRLDDPVSAVERLAPRTVTATVKDVALAFTPRGLCWQARPVGSGVLPMPDLLAILHRSNPDLMLSIDVHPRTFDLPIFEPTWLGYFPNLKAESLAAVVRMAATCERRYAEGSLARPEVVESIPWADRDLDWLASSLGYLRSVVTMVDRFDVAP